MAVAGDTSPPALRLLRSHAKTLPEVSAVRRTSLRVFGLVGLTLLACASPGCGDFASERSVTPRGSLGRELFAVLCDRVGAQALREDIDGSSYRAVCHADANGAFASNVVDTALLPPLEPGARDVDGHEVTLEQQEKNRDHRVARIEALARRRSELIDAFDTAFTGETVAVKRSSPSGSCEGGGEAELRDELGNMLGRLGDLYDDDTIPHFTRGLGGVLDAVERSEDAQAALARFDGRQGYRPREIAMGVARPLLSYPRLVDLANAALPLVSNNAPNETRPVVRQAGKAHGAFVALLAGLREELRTASLAEPALALTSDVDSVDPTLVRLNRPRGSLELTRTLLLDVDPAFSVSASPQWLVERDPRGFARVALADGRVPAPFVDVTGPNGKADGLPDVDALGRFITKGGTAATPFAIVDEKASPRRDATGRAPEYDYLDVSETFLASLTRDLVPLLDPDPKHQSEAVMDLVGGFAAVAGARTDTERSYSAGNEARTVRYRGIDPNASPLLDLVHAGTQLLADPRIDDTLSLLYQLAKDKPSTLARIIGIALELKEIADRHPEAHIPEQSTFWDEIFDVLAAMAEKPALFEALLRSFESDATVDLQRSARAFALHRDELTYDRANLNGPTYNLATSTVDTLVTPVDRSKPDTGTNRSAFQRFLQVLHDSNGLSICTKEGAVAHLVWKGVAMDFPSTAAQAACVTVGKTPPQSRPPRCGLFRIKNVAEEIINAVLGKMELEITDECMKAVVASPLTGIAGGSDALFEQMSGIKGFNTHPTIPGLARVMYFEVPHGNDPGDTQNPLTLNFLKDLFEELPTTVCPRIPFTDRDGVVLNIRECATRQDGIRVRDSNALFPLERFGFLEALKPLAQAFYDNQANMMFVDLFDTFHRHWGSPGQTKDECDPSLPKDDARWCSQDGAVSYEAPVAEMLETDLFRTIQSTVKDLQKIPIRHCTARDAKGTCTQSESWDGVKTLAETIRLLVDPKANVGLKNRRGEIAVTRNDGTKNPQVTPLYLFVDALKGFDMRLRDFAPDGAPDDRTTMWRRGRSRIVDQFFSVNGEGADATLKNRAIATILPTLIATIRSQRAAHCPDSSKSCAWARSELDDKATKIVTSAVFAGLVDVLDAVRSDERARTELERLFVYLLDGNAEGGRATVTALADLLQVFEDDASMTALLHAVAESAAPEVEDESGRVVSRGFLAAAVEALHRVSGERRDENATRRCDREVDPNRTLPVVLRRLVTPAAEGKRSPVEIMIDAIADVNRMRPQETGKLDAADYGSIAREVDEFLTDPTRGLEQVYAVLKQATAAD